MPLTRRILFFLLYWGSRLMNHIRLSSLPEHRANVRASRRILRQMRAWSGEGLDRRCMDFMRELSPSLFEELVLTALEESRQGIIVFRSVRYTGDGGLDGAWWAWRRGRGAIQSKRYRRHVRPEHVQAFANLLRRRRKTYQMGLFVHTGRTGAGSVPHTQGQEFCLVSGLRLTSLMLRGLLPPGAAAHRLPQ